MFNKLETFYRKHPITTWVATATFAATTITLCGTLDNISKSRVFPLNMEKNFPPELEPYIDDKEKQIISEDSAYRYVRENFDLDKNKKLSSAELELARIVSDKISNTRFSPLPSHIDISKRNIFKAIEKIREEEKAQVK